MNNRISYQKDPVTNEPIATLKGRFTMADLTNILSEMEKQTGQMPAGEIVGSIEVIPIVSSETGEPRVELQSKSFDQPLQMQHSQAFALAHALLEVTAVSINDAVFVGFISEDLQIPREQSIEMLGMFRSYRDRLLSNGKDKGQP